MEREGGRETEAGKVAFLYSGEGRRGAGMARGLYASEPAFREALDRCETASREERGTSLLAVLVGEEEEPDGAGEGPEALYALQHALTALWASVGVRPDVVFGDGAGEIAAASAASVFEMAAGLRLAARRKLLVEGERGDGEGTATSGGAAPSLPLVSGVSGRVLEGVSEAGYWRRQAREPVRFETALETLSELEVKVVVEIGPEGELGARALRAWPGAARPAVVSSPGGDGNGNGNFAAAVAAAYDAGLGVSLAGLFAGERRQRVALPTYPFQRERYWLGDSSPAALPDAKLEELLHQVVWREGPPAGPVSAAFLADPETVARGVRGVAEILADEGVDPGELVAEDEALERESRWFVLRAFEDLGWERRGGDRFEGEALRRRLKITGDHRRLFARLLTLLEEAGVLARGPAGDFVVAAGAEDPPPEAVRAPEGAPVSVERALLRRCGAALSEVLRGRADALELLFGGQPGAAELYRESRVGRVTNRLGREAVAAAVAELPAGRRLRVLEVGAGTGATTAAVLDALPAGRTDYDYTDVSAAFLAAAESRFGASGVALRPAVLDIERDPVAQGFAGHRADLLIAANVLHATRDLGEALRRCRRLLAPAGLLLAVEGAAPRAWLDLTFGLLPGWWRFEDAYRSDYALIGPDGWRRALADAGYGEARFLPGAANQTVIVARGPREVETEPGLFVLAGGGDVAEELAGELRKRKRQVTHGPPDADREAWRSFFGSLPEEVPLRGVAYLEGLREDGAGHTVDGLATELETVCGGALSLVQGLADAGVRPVDGVWFVTRGGQVVEGERTGALSGASLWGFASAVGWEQGDLNPRLVDLDPEEAAAGPPLADELMFPDRETRVARRGGVRRVARLVRLPEASGGPPRGERLRSDRSYLVTGGLGGVGLEVAGWLAARGAGTLVLNGRRPPGVREREAVAALRGRGVEVRVEIADVTDGEAVEAMVARMDAELPPLGGVIHSVGALSDGVLANQDWSRFEAVLGPKILGAWRLHRATVDRDLDLFVLFSSVAGVVGNAGQANHAAANAFLDQLARHRRALGLPAQAIAWGPWAGVGEAAEQRERMAGRPGSGAEEWIAPERGLEALARLVEEDVETSVVAAADWSRLALPLASRPPLLDELAPAGAVAAPDASGALAVRLRTLPFPEWEDELIRFLQAELVSVLRLRSVPSPEAGFFELGMDSLMAVELRNRLNRALAGELTVSNTAVFDHPDAARLARHLGAELQDALAPGRAVRAVVGEEVAARGSGEEGVAIIGMACRFPGGADLAAFRRLLFAGGDAVTRGRPDGLFVDAETEAARAYGGYVEGLDEFDAGFFRIAPVEAELLDPQQRMLLEVSWAALEDAGLDPAALHGSRTGVYGGICGNDYQALTMEARAAPTANLYRATGVTASTAVGRVAFALGFEGPAITVDTACSSSLVAVHQAAMALRQGEADLALAGGVNAVLTSEGTRILAEGGMLAADGRCKTFDEAADGYVRGEGCGVLVLKRLREAERDGDRILGVLLGSAVNQDGASAGLTVPNGPAQERVIGEALERAGVEASSVDYLEAHGTGTELGDPIEVQAAAAVYGAGRDPSRPLLLGSVKTNIGHLEGAAGVAGLIKTVLAVREGVVPKHLHFERPNPRIPWEELPVRVAAETAGWPEADRPRRAAVSSLGYSGTNAHLILESWEEERRPEERRSSDRHRPPQADETPCAPRTHHVLPLSGKTPDALRDLARRYLDFLTEDAPLADVAWTAGVGRSHFPYRAGVVFRDADSLRAGLERVEQSTGSASGGGKVAFLFSGQGAQRAGMGKELFEREPAFREVLERCEEVVREERGDSLLSVMFGEGGGELDAAAWAQPALYALQAGLTALWRSVGVEADAVLGYGAGELAAAQATGLFGLEEGLRFASRRGALLGSPPPGRGMAAVFVPLAEVEAELRKTNARVRKVGLSLAADHGTHCLVSGPRRLLASLRRRLERRGVRTEGSAARHAIHGGALEPVLVELESAAGGISFGSPSVPVVSGASGAVAGEGELEDAAYWRRQARSPVRFASGIASLANLGVGVLVEVGPRGVLGPLALSCWPSDREAEGVPAVVSSQNGEEGLGDGEFARAVSSLYAAGIEVSFAGLHAAERRRRVSVPGYPFQRERYWVKRSRRLRTGSADPLLGVRHGSASGEVVFETEWSVAWPPWLGEHRVYGRAVAPGALYGIQAAAALRAATSRSGTVLVEDVRIERPLVLGDGESPGEEPPDRAVQMVLGNGDAPAEREFAVYSRAGEEGWVRHAVGRVAFGPEGGEDLSAAARSALEARLAPASVAAWHDWFRSTGVEHGPAFRGLARLWTGTGEALGELRAPEGLSGEDGAAPTVLLDSAFRVLAGAHEPHRDGAEEPWLPVAWERLWLAEALPARVWCRAERRSHASGSGDGPAEDRIADLWLYGEGGEAVGGVRGFRLRRATRSTLLAATAGVEDLLYAEQWRPSAAGGRLRPAAFLADPAVAAPAARRVSAELPAVAGGLPDDLAAGLEGVARSYALAALEALGWERRAGRRVNAEELRRALRVAEGQRRLFGRILSMLGEAGLLAAGEAPSDWMVVAGPEEPLPKELGDPEAQAAALLARHSGATAEIGLLQRCGRALAEAMRGRVEGTELLFSGEPDAETLYRESPRYRATGDVLSEMVSQLAPAPPDGERLRVLEVGAGTGASTGAVLPALPEGRTSYAFTDLSAGFFDGAERRLGGPAADAGVDLEFRALDIERDPVEQGFAPHRFDLVLAANVLHATRDLGESLRHCRRLLAPAGVLVLLEGTERRSWLDLTFGLLPGWWRFDDRYRHDYPLVPLPVWRRALEDAEFGPGAEVELGPLGAVFAARAPAVAVPDPGLWVVWPDPETDGRNPGLSRALADRGQRVVTLAAGADPRRRDSWRALFDGLPSSPLCGVVHLGGLATPGEDAATETMWESVRGLSESALALLQGLSDAGARPGLGVTLVTRGAQVLGEETGNGFAGSVLWGLGRSAAREFGGVPVRLVDLDPDVAEASGGGGEGLAEELLYPDREEEVAYRGGARRVRRLTRLTVAGAAAVERVRADRSYLVTGGLGGIGLRVADWLGRRGAGAIVLNGRRPPEGSAAETVEALRGRGFAVRTAIADVTDGEAVGRMVSDIERAGLPPLGGVFHAVGVVSDRTLVNQDRESFETVLRPKVLGAWNLHRATLRHELELFVLFSAVAGWIGNAGQSNHAAANAWLDGLAAWRRSRGLAGQAIAWGPWSGVGEAEEMRERIEERLAAMGGWLTPGQGLRALDRLVGEDVARSAVALADWGAPGASSSPLFEDFVAKGAAAEPRPAARELLARLRRTAGPEREAVLVRFLREEVSSVLRLPEPPAVGTGFFELGMDSLMAVELRNRLSRALGAEVSVPGSVVFDYPDIGRLARYLGEQLGAPGEAAPSLPRRLPVPAEERVAVVGMAGRLPGGPDLGSFWRCLAAGADLVRKGRPDELMLAREGEDAAPWGAYVAGLDRFDAAFFRIAPVEAELMDPQQRLLLETSWEALEDAGLDPEGLRDSRTGVYAGITGNDYAQRLQDVQRDAARGAYLTTGVGGAATVGRVSFALGLRGPAIAVDTACSSSLVAVHQAVVAVLRGEADLALAGGVNAILAAGMTDVEKAAGMLSPRGRCSTFDAAADGFVRGEGCGMLVLKRLSEAERDGDRILGVVLGSAVNQDGASAGFTVPNGPAQEAVIREALARAGIEPGSVDYLEAHGSGTELGDPIEVQAAAAVYGEGREAERPLLLGSVKTNVGHLESAAGIAGMLKVLLSLGADEIPPHLHFERPNPRIPWDDLPVRVTSEETPWPEAADRPRRAAVSSFGYSGTNAHLILESRDQERRPQERRSSDRHRPPPADETPHTPRTHRVLPLSGKTPNALRDLARRYLDFLTDDAPLADVAWTAGVGRSHFEHRAGVVFRDPDSLRAGLERVERRAGSAPAGGKVAFLYPGEGSERAGMGRDLYEQEPVFREVLDRCETAFREERQASLLAVMFGDAEGLDRTEWAQPALYALQSALGALWASVGVRPEAVFGHGAGEIAAASAAGVFDLEAGLCFARRRGELLGSLPSGGAMAAVFAPAERVTAAVSGSVSVAADNGTYAVVSGPEDAVAAVAARFETSGVRVERLRASRAFHSAAVDVVLEEIEAAAGSASAPAVPWVRGAGGQALEGAPEGAYWRRQARETVAFGRALRTLSELGAQVLLEIAPAPALGPLASRAWPAPGGPVVLSSPGRGGAGDFAEAVGSAYEAGLSISFAGLFAGERRRRRPLPTYPFQRERYWIAAPRRRPDAGHPILGVRHELARGDHTFETGLSAARQAWMFDHRVFGRPVVPGAYYAVQGLAAVRGAGAASGVAFVEEVRIERPLLLPEDPAADRPEPPERTVQLLLGRAAGRAPRTFEVYSRGEGEGDGSWVRHAVGRVRTVAHAGAESFPANAREALGARLVSVRAAELEARLGEAGLRYGPAFRVIERLWAGPDECLGELCVPGARGSESGERPTVLLDAGFRLLAGAALSGTATAGEAWMPVGWDRLWLAEELPERLWCRAKLRDEASANDAAGGGSGIADLWFHGDDGRPLGGVTGFRFRRTARSALFAASVEVDALLYREDWREAGATTDGVRAAAFARGPRQVAAGVPVVEAEPERPEDGRLEGFAAELEGLARVFALRVLEELGFEPRAGWSFDEEELRRGLRVVEQHGRLFGRLLSLLEEAGALRAESGGPRWTVVAGSGDSHSPPAGPADPEAYAARLLERYPAGSLEIGLLRRCGAELAEVLRGRSDGAVLLASGDPDAAAVLGRSPGYRRARERLSAVVSGLASGWPAGERLRVLGLGGVGTAVLPEVARGLPADRTEVVWSGESADRFRELAGQIEDVEVRAAHRALDIEREPAEQGFGRHRHDLVLAMAGLHATRDLGEALANCRKLLAPAGVLVTLAGRERRGWEDLTFGLLPGWWRFADGYRKDHPHVSAHVWRRAVRDAGFAEVAEVEAGVAGSVLLARAPAKLPTEPGGWVVWPGAGAEGCGAELIRELEAREQEVLTLPEDRDPHCRESWRELFAAPPASGRLRGVAHLEAHESAGGEAGSGALWERVRGLSASALALLQGLSDAGARPELGVTLVTRGGQVLEGDRGEGLPGAVLWGLGRAAAQETGDIRVRLVDLDPHAGPGSHAGGKGWPASLAAELLYPDREEEVVHRGGLRRVRRLVRAVRAAEGAPDRVRSDRSYLVTGGLGGLGLRVAGWLAEKGAGAVVLGGRRTAAQGGAAEAVASLRASGAEVRVEVLDVADGAAVTKLVGEIGERGLPPLGGVVHAAGVLSDRALVNQDRESFDRVLRPKVLGAWNLHRATAELDLELFVLFSSLAGFFGSAGQTNYAAANAFVEGLAAWRRARGLAGQAVAWGAWSGVGEAEAARARIGGRLEVLGAGWLTPEQGIEALDRVVGQDWVRSAAAVVDWEAVDGVASPLFEEFASGTSGPAAGAFSGILLERLEAADPAEREGLLVRFLREQVQSVLRLPEPPGTESGFFELGMDSLTAVELRNRLSGALGGQVSVTDTVVFDHPAIGPLARHLAGRVSFEREAPPRSGDPGRASAVRAEYERARRMGDEEFFAEADALLGGGRRSGGTGCLRPLATANSRGGSLPS